MIVCSCNVFSDNQVRSVVAKEARRPRMSEVYAGLGCSAQCGRCAHTIKRIMDRVTHMLAEKFILALETLIRSRTYPDGSPRVASTSPHVPVKLGG